MATLDESTAQQDTFLNAALVAGLDVISLKGEVEFTRYVKLVLPLDGSVFWVRADLVNPSEVPKAAQGDLTLVAPGSLHYATDLSQEEAETYATNRVVFTSEVEVTDLNVVDPEVMYVGEVPDTDIRFAFSSRGSFYRQADIFHYVGHAVYSVLATQIIDDPAQIDVSNAVVSNSLPIWLSMNGYVPADWEYFGIPTGLTLYPSFLSPANAAPPYGTVYVESTAALAATPNLDSQLDHSQLMADRVRVTLYGLRAADAMTFVDFVNQFSINTDLIGVMNMPAMRDGKRPQVEFQALAQQKVIDYEVSYYQRAARNIARQLIKNVLVSYFIGSGPPLITSNGGGPAATVNVVHPATYVTTVVVSSIAGVAFALSGADASLFKIDQELGVLSFTGPSQVGTRHVTVEVGSLYGEATQAITVNVS